MDEEQMRKRRSFGRLGNQRPQSSEATPGDLPLLKQHWSSNRTRRNYLNYCAIDSYDAAKLGLMPEGNAKQLQLKSSRPST
jgi:hypothetical protein